MFSFIETKLFTRLVQEYLTDDEYSELQGHLLARRKVVGSFRALAEFANFDGGRPVEASEAATESSTI